MQVEPRRERGFFVPVMGAVKEKKMPKERIYGKVRQAEGEAEQHDLLVQWAKSEDVHVRDDDGYSGMLVIAAVKQQTEDTAPVWVHLDRTAANRLISALRRGRNQAFGQDE